VRPSSRLAGFAFGAAERGLVPDPVIRGGVRVLARRRLRSLGRRPEPEASSLSRGPIAPAPDEANEQHYEVPAEFYQLVLGPWRKYSCGYWPDGVETLEDSETAMLDETVAMAGIAAGQDVLDLGCGWGSFSLYAARAFPGARFTAVSNSGSQRAFIECEAARLGLRNLRVVTADVNDLALPDVAFDRVVSVEMFEHMSNYAELMRRIERWLRPGGELFVHVFCHRASTYRFAANGAGDWMGREFFTGGLMPAADLLPRFAGELALRQTRRFSGTHYRRTSEAWLARLDENRDAVLRVFARTHGETGAARQLQRWRLFFLACAETFGYGEGAEWGVAHYRFAKPAAGTAS